jgi:hypothetical protein
MVFNNDSVREELLKAIPFQWADERYRRISKPIC